MSDDEVWDESFLAEFYQNSAEFWLVSVDGLGVIDGGISTGGFNVNADSGAASLVDNRDTIADREDSSKVVLSLPALFFRVCLANVRPCKQLSAQCATPKQIKKPEWPSNGTHRAVPYTRATLYFFSTTLLLQFLKMTRTWSFGLGFVVAIIIKYGHRNRKP